MESLELSQREDDNHNTTTTTTTTTIGDDNGGEQTIVEKKCWSVLHRDNVRLLERQRLNIDEISKLRKHDEYNENDDDDDDDEQVSQQEERPQEFFGREIELELKIVRFVVVDSQQQRIMCITSENDVRVPPPLDDPNIVLASELHVIDLKSGQVQSCTSLDYDVLHMVLCPDGHPTLVSTSGIHVFNLNENADYGVVDGHDFKRCSMLMFSPDVTACGFVFAVLANYERNSVIVVDYTSGKTLCELGGHTDVIKCVDISLQHTVVSCSRDGTIRLWDVFDGECYQCITTHRAPVQRVCFSPDGTTLTSASAGKMYMWEMQGMAPGIARVICATTAALPAEPGTRPLDMSIEYVRSIRGSAVCQAVLFQECPLRQTSSRNEPLHMCCSPGGTVVGLTTDYGVRCFDRLSGQLIRDVRASEVNATVLTHKWIVCGGRFKVHVFNVRAGIETQRRPVSRDVVDMVVSADRDDRSSSHSVYALGGFDSPLTSLNADNLSWNSFTKPIRTNFHSTAVAVSASCRHVAVAYSDGVVRMYVRALNREEVGPDPNQSRPGVPIRPTGPQIPRVTVPIHMPKALVKEPYIKLPDEASAIGLSRDDGTLVVGLRTGFLSVFTTRSVHAQFFRQVFAHRGGVTRIVWDSDNRHVFTCGHDNIKKIEAMSGLHAVVYEGHDAKVNCIALSSGRGKYLISGSDDKQVIVWRSDSNLRVKTFLGHSKPVLSVCAQEISGQVGYMHDAIVVSTSADESVRVWKLSSGNLLYMLTNFANRVDHVGVTKNGILAAAGPEIIHYDLTVVDRQPPIKYFRDLLWGDSLWNNLRDPRDTSLPPVVADHITQILQKFPGIVLERDLSGKTILHDACIHRDAQALRVLLAASKCRAFPADNRGLTPLDLCLRMNSKACLAQILAHTPHIPPQNRLTVVRNLCDLARNYPDLLLATFRALDIDKVPPSVTRGFSLFQSGHNVIMHGSQSAIPPAFWRRVFGGSIAREQRKSVMSSMHSSGADDSEHGAASGEDVTALPLLEQGQKSSTTTSFDSYPAVSSSLSGGVGPTDVRSKSHLSVDDDGMELSVPSQAYMLGLPGLSALWQIENPIRVFVSRNLVDLMGTPLVKHTLEYKWKMYARHYFILEVVKYIVFMALFTVSAVLTECESYFQDARSSLIGVMDVTIFIWTLYYLWKELTQMSIEGHMYFEQIWNYLDLACYSLLVVAYPARLACWGSERELFAVAAVLLWLKSLSLARGFASFGPFVRMLISIVEETTSFLGILTLMVAGFSLSFYLLFRDDNEQNMGSWLVLVKVYIIMLGEAPDDEVFDAASTPWLAYVLFVAYIFLVAIIMLNLLIALMSTVHERIQSNVHNEWILEWAKIIFEIESFLPQSVKTNPLNFPEYIMLLKPTGVPDDDEISEQIHEVREEVRTLREEMTTELKNVTSRMRDLHTTIMAGQTQNGSEQT